MISRPETRKRDIKTRETGKNRWGREKEKVEGNDGPGAEEQKDA